MPKKIKCYVCDGTGKITVTKPLVIVTPGDETPGAEVTAPVTPEFNYCGYCHGEGKINKPKKEKVLCDDISCGCRNGWPCNIM